MVKVVLLAHEPAEFDDSHQQEHQQRYQQREFDHRSSAIGGFRFFHRQPVRWGFTFGPERLQAKKTSVVVGPKCAQIAEMSLLAYW